MKTLEVGQEVTGETEEPTVEIPELSTAALNTMRTDLMDHTHVILRHAARAAMTIARSDGSVRCEVRSSVCHGFVRHFCAPQMNNESHIIGLVTSPNKDKWNTTPQVGFELLEYLAHRSPYRQCFIDKDISVGLKHGFQMDVGQPSNILQGALIATRMPQDYGKQVQFWYTLVNDFGMSEDLAFYLCSVPVLHYNRETVDEMWKLHGECSSHLPLYPMSAVKGAIDNFLDNTPAFECKSLRELGSYSRVASAWGEVDDPYTDSEIGESFKEIKGEVTEEYSERNWEDEVVHHRNELFSEAGVCKVLAEWGREHYPEEMLSEEDLAEVLGISCVSS